MFPGGKSWYGRALRCNVSFGQVAQESKKNQLGIKTNAPLPPSHSDAPFVDCANTDKRVYTPVCQFALG